MVLVTQLFDLISKKFIEQALPLLWPIVLEILNGNGGGCFLESEGSNLLHREQCMTVVRSSRPQSRS
jgi:hypothetical protein